jgi:hypothetical protein
MRRSTLVLCALVTVATSGCEQLEVAKGKLRLAWDKLRGRTTQTAPPPAAARPALDTAGTRVTAQQEQAFRPRPPAIPEGSGPLTRDVPYVSEDTGTIAPGMAEREIYLLWAAPVAVRRVGEYTYLFFRNGCEYTCGTMDVVTLQNGRVVDAIVRWDGHRYSGESSSPPGRVPFANPGGEHLQVPPPPPQPPPPSSPTGT